MRRMVRSMSLALAAGLLATAAHAHRLREAGQEVAVDGSQLVVNPARDWNRLSGNIGANTETWTLDGEQLNDVTFYTGIEPGRPLVRERSKKRDPLPKFTESTLLIEIPELLEGTYRTYKRLAAFEVLTTEPVTFLGRDGVKFTYEFTDADDLVRRGEAHAAIIDKRLFMATFDAPRLHYYDRNIADFRQLVQSARYQGR